MLNEPIERQISACGNEAANITMDQVNFTPGKLAAWSSVAFTLCRTYKSVTITLLYGI